MMQRLVVEELQAGNTALPSHIDHVAIVGFNVLNPVERKLFQILQREAATTFYWDYDTYYTADENAQHEAGFFMRQNLREFPNALPEECFNNLLQSPKEITFVSANNDNVQARYVTPWLQKHLTADPRRTAIVLCDENLLQPVLHALPSSISHINITKGYPLSATNTYATLLSLMDKWEKKTTTCEDFVAQLQQGIKELTESDAPLAEQSQPYEVLEQEARFHAYTVLTRFASLLGQGRLTMEVGTLHSLIRNVLRVESIPFQGEPVEGLQIMGVLETRCLDFENLLILSTDDNQMPRRESNNSFIPYFLREAYGLQTKRHSAALYAYYFYRMLSRANCVHAVWSNNDAIGVNGGDMSRFMTQLLVEAPTLQIKKRALQVPGQPLGNPPLKIEKPANLTEIIHSLSPSSLNTYLECPAKFYFTKVRPIETWEEPTDEIAKNVLGTIFHNAAEALFTDLSDGLKKPITAERIRAFLNEQAKGKLRAYVNDAFLKTQATERSLRGTLSDYPVQTEVLIRLLRDLLQSEQRQCPIQILDMEKRHNMEMEIQTADGTHQLRIGGFIDRLDIVGATEADRVMRVLDYKTGKKQATDIFKSVADLFKPGKDRPKYIFQTFLYALVVQGLNSYPIRPALHYAGQAHLPEYTAYVDLKGCTDVRTLLPEFQEHLKSLLEEIFDLSTPFSTHPDKNVCEYCPAKNFCAKNL